MNIKSSRYFIINVIFTIIIGVVLSYSYFFYPNNHPLYCLYKLKTGLNCSTCGFSRAFSSFTHFEFKEGVNYNKQALACYLFFVSQFLFRLTIVLISRFKENAFKKPFITAEIVLTILLFLYAFYPLLM
jgi:hypothetical protein